MKFIDFEPIWKRMCTYYGKTEFIEDKDMIKIYWDEIKYVNSHYDVFEQAIYNKNNFFPKIKEICEIKKQLSDAILDEKRTDIDEPVCECKRCNSTGYRIIKDERMREYATACDCKNGDNKLYDGRTILDKAHRSLYIIPRYSQVIPKDYREEA